jgi:hypothetical protein
VWVFFFRYRALRSFSNFVVRIYPSSRSSPVFPHRQVHPTSQSSRYDIIPPFRRHIHSFPSPTHPTPAWLSSLATGGFPPFYKFTPLPFRVTYAIMVVLFDDLLDLGVASFIIPHSHLSISSHIHAASHLSQHHVLSLIIFLSSHNRLLTPFMVSLLTSFLFEPPSGYGVQVSFFTSSVHPLMLILLFHFFRNTTVLIYEPQQRLWSFVIIKFIVTYSCPRSAPCAPVFFYEIFRCADLSVWEFPNLEGVVWHRLWNQTKISPSLERGKYNVFRQPHTYFCWGRTLRRV